MDDIVANLVEYMYGGLRSSLQSPAPQYSAYCCPHCMEIEAVKLEKFGW